MKTYKEWDHSGLDFDYYINAPCEVDEELYHHFSECGPVTWQDESFFQSCEATSKTDIGTFTFDTFMVRDNRYYYLGVLPAFKGSEYDYKDTYDNK